MAASQIPNLLDTLRASRTARGGNVGVRRGGGASATPSESKDKVVQQTDEDASGSRLSAVEAGYLDDAFARVFANTTSPETPRRMPIINRGTYVRTTALDVLVTQFLAMHSGQPTQIVSLGAGTDTRFFRLLQGEPGLAHSLRYHELDFPESTAKKIRAIKRAPFVKAMLQNSQETRRPGLCISEDETSLTSSSYFVHPIDLRALASESPDARVIPHLDPATPTLILSECCLTYLPSHIGSSILKHITSTLLHPPTPVLTVLYEPLHPSDAFGRTMTRNLRARGIDMPSLLELETLDAHGRRLTGCLQAGNEGVVGWNGLEVRRVWKEWVSEEEKERLRVLEGLDEEEEWELLAGHYGVVWAWRGMKGDDFGGGVS